MSIRCKITILRARAREKTKHLLYYAYFFDATRSIKENKRRKGQAKDAATAERMATLERALEKTSKTPTYPKKAAPRKTPTDPKNAAHFINIKCTGPVSCSCFRISALG